MRGRWAHPLFPRKWRNLAYSDFMLCEFLTLHRAELIKRCRESVAKRASPEVSDTELSYGVPLFLDQLIKTLEVEQTSRPMESRKVSGTAGGGGITPTRRWKTSRPNMVLN